MFPNPRFFFRLQPQKDALETEIQSPFFTYRKMGHWSPQEWGNPQLIPTAAPNTAFVPFSSLHIHPGGGKISRRGEEFSCCSSLALQPRIIPFLCFPSRAQVLLSLPWIPPRKASGAQWNLGGKKRKKEKSYLESDYEFFSHPLLDTSSWNNVGRERDPHPLSSTCKLREQMWSLVLPCKVAMGILSFISFLIDSKKLEGI